MSSLAVPVDPAPGADAAARDRATVEVIRSMRDPGCRPAQRRRLREDVIRRQLPLARRLARGYADRGEPVEDLVQVAALALVKAVDGFDPDRGPSFAGYAYPTILGELKRHFRDRSWSVHVPRKMQERCLEVTRTRADLVQRLHRTPSATEIAEVLGIPETDVRATARGTSAYRADSLNRPVGSPDDPCEYQDLLGAPDRNLETLFDRVMVEPALDALPERARHALRRYFFDNRTQDEIAAELQTSQMSVSRLLNQALAHLRSQLSPPSPSPSPSKKEARGAVRVYTYEARPGCLVATVSCPAAVAPRDDLKDALIRILLSDHPRTLVVDLRRLPYADLATVRALLQTYRAAGHVGARICVVNVAADLLELLRRTGVARLLACLGVPAGRRAGSSDPAAGTPASAAPVGADPHCAPSSADPPQRHGAVADRRRPGSGPAGTCRLPVDGQRPRSRKVTSAVRAPTHCARARRCGTARPPHGTAWRDGAMLSRAIGGGLARRRPPHNGRAAGRGPVSGRSRPPPSQRSGLCVLADVLWESVDLRSPS